MAGNSYERSGASNKVTSKRRGSADSRSNHQPTASTSYYAGHGDEGATELIRSMYGPSPSPYGGQTLKPDAS